jgi:hypothetical protein
VGGVLVGVLKVVAGHERIADPKICAQKDIFNVLVGCCTQKKMQHSAQHRFLGEL